MTIQIAEVMVAKGACPSWWCRRPLVGLLERPSRGWHRQAEWRLSTSRLSGKHRRGLRGQDICGETRHCFLGNWKKVFGRHPKLTQGHVHQFILMLSQRDLPSLRGSLLHFLSHKATFMPCGGRS